MSVVLRMPGAIATTILTERLPGSFCACAAACKCLSATVVITATCNAPQAVPGKPDAARSVKLVAVTRRAVAGASIMLCGHAATLLPSRRW
jgi:hypothetical protein